MRLLDGMAVLKLNVLHIHCSDDQGFRIESLIFPELQSVGVDTAGEYWTQEDTKKIISHARILGIRILPEFDMPGHTSSWLVGYPIVAH